MSLEPGPTKCPQCGSLWDEPVVFCGECGARIGTKARQGSGAPGTSRAPTQTRLSAPSHTQVPPSGSSPLARAFGAEPGQTTLVTPLGAVAEASRAGSSSTPATPEPKAQKRRKTRPSFGSERPPPPLPE
jgi:hypothetical protein